MLARFGGPLYVTDDYIPGIYTDTLCQPLGGSTTITTVMLPKRTSEPL